MAVSIQVTLYCWIGNEITLTGATVPLAIYKSDWITATSSFRKGMLINMTRMQRNLCITIGKFSPLTLATLVAIFRGSYSYFALLQSQKMRE
nr:odorant receptor 43a-like [Onthophagus taurus]